MQISKCKITIKNLKSKRGYVTITVLILMMVLVAVTYLYSDALFADLTIARNNKGAQAAFSLAEAGVQEAIYRVQYDATTRDAFLNTADGTTTFSHDPALLPQGAYTVTIQNLSEGSATVTAVGTYKIGTRTAQREIKVGIAQGNTTPYPYDGGVFSVAGPGEANADVDVWWASMQIYGGSLLSNRDINFKFEAYSNIEENVEAHDDVVNQFSEYNCNCLISDDGDPETPQCGDSPGCSPLEGVTQKPIPGFNFDYYKAQAQAQGQYFSKQKDFKDLVPKGGSRTFNGVVYIDSALDIDWARTVTINGVLVASGSIDISFGQLFVNRPGSDASGILTQGDFTIGTFGNFSGTGLVYSGQRVQVDTSFPYPMNLTGGFISRKFWMTGFRELNVHFDSDVINTTFQPIVTEPVTPVIEMNHWEEEY